MALGAALALVGAGVVIVVTSTGNIPTVSRTSLATIDQLASDDWRLDVVPATVADPATLALGWNASGPIDVSWYVAVRCNSPLTPWCLQIPALFTWNGSKTGSWSHSGAAAAYYGLLVESPPGAHPPVNFTAVFEEQYRSGPLTMPFWPLVIAMAGGSLLAGIGAVAVYLGIFLPSGTYPRLPDRERFPDTGLDDPDLEEPTDAGPTRTPPGH